MTDIKKGDRVKVTFEAEVFRYEDESLEVESPKEQGISHYFGPRFIRATDLTIEKIEPPVEVFKPGDIVRAKQGGALIALGLEGYTYLQSRYLQPGKTFSHRSGYQAEDFTSESFEKVNIE